MNYIIDVFLFHLFWSDILIINLIIIKASFYFSEKEKKKEKKKN